MPNELVEVHVGLIHSDPTHMNIGCGHIRGSTWLAMGDVCARVFGSTWRGKRETTGNRSGEKLIFRTTRPQVGRMRMTFGSADRVSMLPSPSVCLGDLLRFWLPSFRRCSCLIPRSFYPRFVSFGAVVEEGKLLGLGWNGAWREGRKETRAKLTSKQYFATLTQTDHRHSSQQRINR